MDVYHLYAKLNQVIVRNITLSSGHHNHPPKNKYMLQVDISTKLCFLPIVPMSKQTKQKHSRICQSVHVVNLIQGDHVVYPLYMEIICRSTCTRFLQAENIFLIDEPRGTH